jgi:hypothetical protein
MTNRFWGAAGRTSALEERFSLAADWFRRYAIDDRTVEKRSGWPPDRHRTIEERLRTAEECF